VLVKKIISEYKKMTDIYGEIDLVLIDNIEEELKIKRSRSISKIYIEMIIEKSPNKSTLMHIYLTIPLTSNAKIVLLENIAFCD